ncbi:MAG: hypothetical protein GXP25_02860 [Planctomycetes bacterium]|nr:hypothetical protein [Planctomycetota bacterium]
MEEEVFILGSEHELAAAMFPPHGGLGHISNDIAHEVIQRELKSSGVPYLFDTSRSGLFLYLGRIYMDPTGHHVEFAVCPAGSPHEVVQTEAKMIRLLRDAIRWVQVHLSGFALVHNNYDYITHSTWGQHCNYAIQVPLDALERALVPFLVTRQVFAGPGSVGCNDHGMDLNPRTHFISRTTGGETTSSRSIYSTARNEPLMVSSRFHHRLHLISGCSLMSQFGQWLKLGTTALVIRAAEKDPTIGDAVAFADPVRAIKTLSVLTPDRKHLFDPHLLKVQKHYVRVVADMLQEGDFPKWCFDIWRAWHDTLKRLESDPMALDRRLDPYIKLRLFGRFLQERGKRWHHVSEDESLYYDLALLDVRYHALSGGLFEMLDAEGVLEHKLVSDREATPGSEDDPYVLTGLPRESFRGRMIKKLNGRSQFRCDWQHITDMERRQYLEMHDPLETPRGRWQRMMTREQDAFRISLVSEGELRSPSRRAGPPPSGRTPRDSLPRVIRELLEAREHELDEVRLRARQQARERPGQ